MQYALVDNEPKMAFPNGKGICELCGSALIAKCGPRILHHWAHHKIRNCDPWWENETPWHREWKNLYPENCREISHTDTNGEIHRAAIRTPTGIYIEIHHSSMTDTERLSRELFYKNLIWIVDGRGFKNNFDIYHLLPDPKTEISKDIVWSKARRHMDGANSGIFLRLSDNTGKTKATLNSGRIYSLSSIQSIVEDSYSGYHQYDWIKPRKTWLDATCPVYIDFGGDRLLQLLTYDESNLKCIRFVSKRKLIYDSMVEKESVAIATRFYPLA